MTTTTPPAVIALQEARVELSQPAVSLAAGALDVARRIDFVRHEVPRGDAMAQALADLESLVGEVSERADELQRSAASLDGELDAVRSAVSGLVMESRAIARVAAQDIRFLSTLIDFDLALAAATQRWNTRGSRSEAAERFAELVDVVGELQAQARRLPVQPGTCPGMRDNRVRWADLVAERTEALRRAAAAADGAAFDELRARFLMAPYAEDQVAADAGSRACWATRHPDMIAAEDRVTVRLEVLEAALGG